MNSPDILLRATWKYAHRNMRYASYPDKEDCVQDVCYEFYKYHNPECRVFPWNYLYKICRNVLLNRKGKKRVCTVPYTLHGYNDLFTSIASRDTLECIMQGLPQQQARVLMLRGEGYKACEIGERVGMSGNYVNVMVHKIMKQLKV